MKLLTIQLSDRLHADFKAHCRRTRISMRQYILNSIGQNQQDVKNNNKKEVKKTTRSG